MNLYRRDNSELYDNTACTSSDVPALRVIRADSVVTINKAKQEFIQEITSRVTVAQVVDSVRSSAAVSFDFVGYTLAGIDAESMTLP